MKFQLEQIDDLHMAAVHEARVDDLKAVADHCANLRGIGATGTKDMKLAATIPAFVVQKYINDNGITFAEFMREGSPHPERMLNDPALSYFRVWEGRV